MPTKLPAFFTSIKSIMGNRCRCWSLSRRWCYASRIFVSANVIVRTIAAWCCRAIIRSQVTFKVISKTNNQTARINAR
ncbi:MAG: hypothetical protein N2246_02140 [Candidatus Sumerlaeia bacterium]|nr:hypothetical protein [Candidatus Sumerlaeia bacterium]